MTVILRNTISKQTLEVSEEEAALILSHPKHGAVNEIVDSIKPEVLGQPYTLGADGEHIPVVGDVPATAVEAPAVAEVPVVAEVSAAVAAPVVITEETVL